MDLSRVACFVKPACAVRNEDSRYEIPLTQEANLSAILITDMTICFVSGGANIVKFDTHLNGNFGALIASTTFENTENFLKAVKEMISPNYNTCSFC